MKGFLSLLLLALSVSSLELTGPSTNAARLGSDAWVPCLFTVDNPPVDLNHLTIFWYFLDKEILSYNKTVRTNSSRHSLSTEELLTGVANLTISNIRISDGGRYKCSVIYNSERREKRLWLDVGAPPLVTITDRTVVVNEESVLRCSATGFFPIDIEVKWFRGSERLSDVTVDYPQRNPDRTYSVNSTVTITPTEEDREQNFSCRVRHFYLTDPLQVHFQLIYMDRSSAGIIAVCSILVVILIIIIIAGVLWWKLYPRKKVRDIVGPPKLIAGEEAALYCTVDNAPEDLCVTWLIRRAGQEQEIQTSQKREHSEEEEESLLDTSYVIKSQVVGRQYSSSLSFIPHMERHKDVTFICRGVSGHHNDEKVYHCKMIYVKPKVSKTKNRILSKPGMMTYLLSLDHFNPKNINIVWKCGAEMTEKVASTKVSENPDKTYNVSSELDIPEEQHKDPGFKVHVTWEHESLEKSESRELNIRDSDYRWTPVVEEIQTPRLLLGSPAVLQCNISEYFPHAITVKWMRRDRDQIHEETDNNQRITSRRAADNTYSCTASLTITPDLRTHQGAEYVCLVEHPSLERPIQRSTEPLQVYGKPQMSAPIAITMADSSHVQFSLNLQKFYPEDIKISCRWENTNDNYGKRPDVETKSTQNDDLTYDVTSVVKISNYSFRNPEKKIIVEWEHESMETSEWRSLSVRDFHWRPHVGSISVPRLEDGEEATLTCDISGYFPDLLTVIWFTKKDGDVTELPRTSSSYMDRTYKMSQKEAKQADNTYSCEASLTFTPKIISHQGSEILCRVEHPSEERPIERSTRPLHIDYPWTPIVEEIQIPRLLLDSPAVLQCNMSGYFPDAVTVKWMRRDGDQLHEETDDNQRITSRRAADNTYSRTASLTITPDLRTHQGAEYICLVEHPSLKTPIERRTGRLQVYGKPQMSAPIEITTADKSRVQFSLNLQKFYPKDIKISWSWEDQSGKYGLSAVETISAQDEDLTYEVTSAVQIPGYQFKDPKMKIIVEWEHESMETSETKSLGVRDLPWRPHVGSINVSELEDGKSATLTCDISGYFPDLLSVRWFTKKDGNVTELPRQSSFYINRTYKMSEIKTRQKDNTYSCEASLTFTPKISSHQGSEILCRVEHPSEVRPIERSTGPLHIGKK
ncbi:uncharacterized protein [Dendrobates tinctorius]|uniref:uncharacterized protein n=1 Tax=Dendrobates tinctorius TaxID=92724 RepID=UPI003CC993C5